MASGSAETSESGASGATKPAAPNISADRKPATSSPPRRGSEPVLVPADTGPCPTITASTASDDVSPPRTAAERCGGRG